MTGGPLRVGLVGCGNVALRLHLPGYRRLPADFAVVAIADASPEQRERGRAEAGLDDTDAHADPFELIRREDVEVVDLCTPQFLRRDLAVAAASAGHHILSEKPIATTPRLASEIVSAAREAGVLLGMNHNYLFFPEVRRTLEIVAAGEIGAVEVAILNWLGVRDVPGAGAYRPGWRHDLGLAGGGVLMDMLHIVYLAEAFLGGPIERVSGYVDARAEGAPVEDIALCRFETDRNVALVNVGWGTGPGGFSVTGASGRIEVTYERGGSGAFAPFERLVVDARGGRREETSLPPVDSTALVLADFGAAVRAGRDPIAPGEQGQHILEATLAVYLSAALGRTVELPLDPASPVYKRGAAGLRELDLPIWSPVVRRRIFGVREAVAR